MSVRCFERAILKTANSVYELTQLRTGACGLRFKPLWWKLLLKSCPKSRQSFRIADHKGQLGTLIPGTAQWAELNRQNELLGATLLLLLLTVV